MDVAEFFVNGQLFFGSDSKRFVEFPAGVEDVGDSALCDGS